jgi:L-2-hydroxyglutarate oxidase LhgO
VAAVNASAGDWLIVRTRGEHERRGVILHVREDGSPPYTVRWTDDGHETVVFPGPDAVVMSAPAMENKERVENDRIKEIQSAIAGNSRASQSS